MCNAYPSTIHRPLLFRCFRFNKHLKSVYEIILGCQIQIIVFVYVSDYLYLTSVNWKPHFLCLCSFVYIAGWRTKHLFLHGRGSHSTHPNYDTRFLHLYKSKAVRQRKSHLKQLWLIIAIRFQTLRVNKELCKANWYHWDISNKRTLLIFLMNSQNGIELSLLGLEPLNFTTYIKVNKKYSFFCKLSHKRTMFICRSCMRCTMVWCSCTPSVFKLIDSHK